MLTVINIFLFKPKVCASVDKRWENDFIWCVRQIKMIEMCVMNWITSELLSLLFITINKL